MFVRPALRGDVGVGVAAVGLAAALFFVPVHVALGAAAVVALVVAAAFVRGASFHGSKLPARRVEDLADIDGPLPPHRQLVRVDPAVFDDLLLAEDASAKVFAAWAKQHRGFPSDPSRFILETKVGARFVGRLTTTFETRTASFEQRSYGGPERPSTSPTITDDVLWSMSEEQLREHSRHIITCDACAGSQRVTCSACGGKRLVTCGNCGGDGKAYGYAKNGARRLMNCTVCKKKGVVDCSTCDDGKVRCAPCDGQGRFERWAVCRSEVRRDIQLEPDKTVTSAFKWGEDGKDVATKVVTKDARVHDSLSSDGAVYAGDIQRVTGDDWFRRHWDRLQPKATSNERVVQQTFEHLEIPSVTVRWALPGTAPMELELEGLRLLAPPQLADQSFLAARLAEQARRELWLKLPPLVVLVPYVLRGAYFLRAEPFVVAALLATGCALFAWALRRRADRLQKSWVPALASVPLLFASSALAFSAEPALPDVYVALERGDLDAARDALHALRDIDEASKEEAGRKIALRSVLLADSSDRARVALSDVPLAAPERQPAEQHIDALVLKEARAMTARGTTNKARIHLTGVKHDKDGMHAAERETWHADGERCLRDGEYSCALAMAKKAKDAELTTRTEGIVRDHVARVRSAARGAPTSDLRRRAQAYGDLARALEAMEAIDASVHAELLSARTEQTKLLTTIAAHEAKERRDAELRAAKAVQAERERQERAFREANRPRRVRCCDGTPSPSCYYGGSLRGCCSHHGGVC